MRVSHGVLLLLALLAIPVAATAQAPSGQYWPFPDGLVPQTSDAPPRPLLRRTVPRVLVIIYHNLVFGRTGFEYARDLYNFEYDLAYFQRNFAIIGFDDLAAAARGDLKLETDAVIITFDDGDLSIYGLAYPVLRQFGLKATFFLISSMLGQVGYVSAGQVREMADCQSPDGRTLFSFQSHTVNHVYLTRIPKADVPGELEVSKAAIEAITGRPVTVLALPFGDGARHPAIRNEAKKAGYSMVRVTDQRPSTIVFLNWFDIGGVNASNTSSGAFTARCEKLMGR
jgi:peptidoglycan/xylan/chitin deacetylase (PgdA/CDA1 family)